MSESGPYPIRQITDSEFEEVSLILQHAFHGSPPTPENRAISRNLFELERSLAAFDGGTPVGSAGAYTFSLTVPGGTTPAAGVTWVSVLPSHRRRGVLRSLMRRQLSDISAAGREPLALLWASEAGIYERYGYGRASWHLSFTLRRGEGTLAPGATGPRVRLAAPQSVRAELAKVYDLAHAARPGSFARSEQWWDRVLNDPEAARGGSSPLRCVLAEDEQGPRGYALYSGTQRWENETFLPDSALTVRELVACDPEASAALWRDLLSRDLTTTFRADLRPVDDPLMFQLADPRRVRPMLSDGLWVRIIDVAAALAVRRYSAPADVVISVRDRDLPGNEGRWRLTTGASASDGRGLEAVCSRTSDAADLDLDVSALGAAYLGGTRLGTLAGAGLVTELRRGAVRELTAAMAWDPAPWCPMIF